MKAFIQNKQTRQIVAAFEEKLNKTSVQFKLAEEKCGNAPERGAQGQLLVWVDPFVINQLEKL